ncbi:hypothetical protein EV363DRAFT_315601 [Boletus edulis]|nr:hypothetical protein EV363DRAFT_315601 [Boletus edulis]
MVGSSGETLFLQHCPDRADAELCGTPCPHSSGQRRTLRRIEKNNRAVVDKLQSDPTTPITIITDSRYLIDGLTKHLSTWEDNGWNDIRNAEWFQAAAYQL